MEKNLSDISNKNYSDLKINIPKFMSKFPFFAKKMKEKIQLRYE